ncbi:hypothetical protein [Comamonas sp. NoAH]|uniref:hypothetical protein n=1 Tax=Comamonas halotolerans TaxID=3041496 RepID=UPI0024E0A486|nr:hypothetical protein [Comamonas sp. NoAH]
MQMKTLISQTQGAALASVVKTSKFAPNTSPGVGAEVCAGAGVRKSQNAKTGRKLLSTWL